MRVLLVGGAGFIGRHLASCFRARGADTYVLDIADPKAEVDRAPDASYRRSLISGVECLECDAGDAGRLGGLIARIKPTLVYYLAAEAVVSRAAERPDDATVSMIHGLANCLNAVRGSASARRFVYISSSMVYGHFRSPSVAEDHATDPLNLYGGLKLAGETMTRALLATSSVEYVIARPSGVYGPGDRHARVVKTICESALARAPIYLINPDGNVIDFTSVDDLAKGLFLAGTVAGAAGQTFNLTYGRGRSLDDLIRVVLDLEPGSRVSRVFQDDNQRPRRGSLSIDKARDILGYEPEVGLELGILRYLDHLRALRPVPVVEPQRSLCLSAAL